ncbi:dimethyl sulfoxide reductase anchor subunit family protein [Luteimonas aquatica]|uniref:dimethyl sulfoxide reductase anchor subunit family protein n=1 Tax=Luteimonas aquatica TaxID=450364 RepID=UPI001F56736C|nr:DmsC/YnfH family molybdoenzyme membrane anchor subunit [Luteimonas aquatica]
MHPAWSVIVFTTLSGAGYGLMVWLGALQWMGRFPVDGAPPWLWAALLLKGLVLSTLGLLSSMLHLGKPGRAWRAFSQWRTSWLSREGVLAVLTALVALALLAPAVLEAAMPRYRLALAPAATRTLLAALVAAPLLTVVCTAMIYASLKPIPAWRHRLVVPAYLAFALLSGAALLGAAQAVTAGAVPAAVAIAIAALALLTGALKWIYWRDIDRQALPVTRGDAIGLPGREPQVFERPHTEGNYLTREMGFVLARRHARKLRAIALFLFAALPALLAALALAVPAAALVALPAAAVAVLLGAMTERWLFFAQARHVVMLYY